MASVTITFGMAQIPVGIAKASAQDDLSLKSLCDCEGQIGPIVRVEEIDGEEKDCKVECRDCGQGYPWYNSAPLKGYELGDEIIPLDGDEVRAARDEPPVDTGNVEKVCPVEPVLLEYAVTGNYYLLPEDDFEDQYGALVHALNKQGLTILTYLQLRSKTQRYAIVSEGGVLIALRLADKKAIPDLEYGTDDGLEAQAMSMLESMQDDDITLENVEGQGIKELVKEKAAAEPQVKPKEEEGIIKEA